MVGMFEEASNFNQDISMWNITNVVNHNSFDSGTMVDWTSDEKPNFPSDL